VFLLPNVSPLLLLVVFLLLLPYIHIRATPKTEAPLTGASGKTRNTHQKNSDFFIIILQKKRKHSSSF
jgi:hypothetical protein